MYCHKLVFCVFPEQLLPFIFWGAILFLARQVHYYKVKQRFPSQKDFIKRLFKGQREKTKKEANSGILKLNKIMSKLLTVSKCFQLSCYKIQQLLAIVTLFWTCRAFSHFTYHLRYYITIIIDYCWKLLPV